MAFNVNYSFNNGASTGTATSITALRSAIYNYGTLNLTQCTLSGTAEGQLTTNDPQGTTAGTEWGIFNNCSYLTSINLSNLDTSNVTSMRNMFSGCSALTEIIGIENLDISNVTDAYCIFNGCLSLTILDLSSFDTGKVATTEMMFSGCANLEHIYVSNKFITTQVTASNYMFLGCTKLPNFNSSSTTKTKAYVGAGGYLELKPAYIIQQYIQYNNLKCKAYPKLQTNLWTGTQAEYDAITTKDSNTLYFIKAGD